MNEPEAVFITGTNFLVKKGLLSLIDGLPMYQAVEVGDDMEQLRAHHYQPNLLVCIYDTVEPKHIDDITQVKETYPIEILLVLDEVKGQSIQTMIDKGVKGIVTQRCSEEEILTAVNATLKGERFMCSKVLDVLMAEPKNTSKPRFYLSAREKEVLKLITKGKTTSEIADKLHVSVHTINSHRKNMLKKLNLKSPIELIVFALENDLVAK
ncbi:response regulator transcription factor [Fulvivirga sp. RKSG066]|uniref:response regulator transcription factor n=1 Tax=Fulvivirga aurantia TaxID=2529383 RepID=UPI0012BD0973|nr:response regulator transcription factor [Fulvivirga aurantia]MTI22026.1 response regulator transcription factor [Fulvivirga aurantia]